MYSPAESAEKDALIKQYVPLVKRIAYHLSARLPDNIQMDDLIQAGLIGLLDASRQYDPTQGAKFETYATIRVRGAIFDEVRRNDWAPKSVHKKARDMAEAIRVIEGRTGRDARDEEVAQELGLSLDEYFQILQESSSCRFLSIDEMTPDEATNPSLMADSSPGVVDGILEEEFRGRLAEAIASLPERERMVMALYYDTEMNLREVGELLNISESRVSQLLSQAQIRLRARLTE